MNYSTVFVKTLSSKVMIPRIMCSCVCTSSSTTAAELCAFEEVESVLHARRETQLRHNLDKTYWMATRERRHEFLKLRKSRYNQNIRKTYFWLVKQGLRATTVEGVIEMLGVDYTTDESLPKVQEQLVFGLHPVRLALLSKRRKKFHRLFVKISSNTNAVEESAAESRRRDEIKRIISLARNRNLPITIVTPKTLERLTGDRPHQGVALDAAPLKYATFDDKSFEIFRNESSSSQALENMDEYGKSKRPLYLFLDKILDIMNFGAIVRSAYILGVEKVFLEQGAGLTPVASKASSGILELKPIIKVPCGVNFLELVKRYGFEVVGTGNKSVICDDSRAEFVQLNDFSLSRPTMLVLGNEGTGISQNLAPLCDRWIGIPSADTPDEESHSLNVSVAAGILMYALQTKQVSSIATDKPECKIDNKYEVKQ